jgi:hypothetical protein
MYVLMIAVTLHHVGILLWHVLPDQKHNIGEIIIVAALELNLATTAVNLPAIRSIWVKGPRSATSSEAQNGIRRRKMCTVEQRSERPSEGSHEMGRVARQAPQRSTLRSMVERFPYISLNRDRGEERTGV